MGWPRPPQAWHAIVKGMPSSSVPTRGTQARVGRAQTAPSSSASQQRHAGSPQVLTQMPPATPALSRRAGVLPPSSQPAGCCNCSVRTGCLADRSARRHGGGHAGAIFGNIWVVAGPRCIRLCTQASGYCSWATITAMTTHRRLSSTIPGDSYGTHRRIRVGRDRHSPGIAW